jgi:hypothetical protein
MAVSQSVGNPWNSEAGSLLWAGFDPTSEFPGAGKN